MCSTLSNHRIYQKNWHKIEEKQKILVHLILNPFLHGISHIGPEDSKFYFFFREIAFLTVLNFFTVQKLIFGNF